MSTRCYCGLRRERCLCDKLDVGAWRRAGLNAVAQARLVANWVWDGHVQEAAESVTRGKRWQAGTQADTRDRWPGGGYGRCGSYTMPPVLRFRAGDQSILAFSPEERGRRRDRWTRLLVRSCAAARGVDAAIPLLQRFLSRRDYMVIRVLADMLPTDVLMRILGYMRRGAPHRMGSMLQLEFATLYPEAHARYYDGPHS